MTEFERKELSHLMFRVFEYASTKLNVFPGPELFEDIINYMIMIIENRQVMSALFDNFFEIEDGKYLQEEK